MKILSMADRDKSDLRNAKLIRIAASAQGIKLRSKRSVAGAAPCRPRRLRTPSSTLRPPGCQHRNKASRSVFPLRIQENPPAERIHDACPVRQPPHIHQLPASVRRIHKPITPRLTTIYQRLGSHNRVPVSVVPRLWRRSIIDRSGWGRIRTASLCISPVPLRLAVGPKNVSPCSTYRRPLGHPPSCSLEHPSHHRSSSSTSKGRLSRGFTPAQQQRRPTDP